MVNEEGNHRRDIKPGEDPELDAQLGAGTQAERHRQSSENALAHFKRLLAILAPDEDYSHVTLDNEVIVTDRLAQFSREETERASQQLTYRSEGAPDPTEEQRKAADEESLRRNQDYFINKLTELIQAIDPKFVYEGQTRNELKAIYEDLRGNQ